MGKFGIGARVRTGAGYNAEIVDKRKGERELRFSDGSTGWWDKSALTAVLPAATDPCAETCEVAYKVGDRVVCVDASGAGEGVYVVGQVYAVAGLEDSISEGQFLRIEGTRSGMFAYRFRPFRLEAGRYYKTRDGRKVGPAEKYGESPYDFRLSVWNYELDGTCTNLGGNHRNDIVAEWVEPEADLKPWKVDDPLVEEVPTAPPRKFKVGDRVNYIGGKSQDIWQGVTITRDSGVVYRATCPKQGEGGFTDSDLDLASPSAPKFKVGDRVVAKNGTALLHVGQEYEILRHNHDGDPVERVYTSSGHPSEHSYGDDWFELATPAAPAFPIGAKVMLAATVTGHNPVDKHNVNVVID